MELVNMEDEQTIFEFLKVSLLCSSYINVLFQWYQIT
jgi:hypothetical protein